MQGIKGAARGLVMGAGVGWLAGLAKASVGDGKQGSEVMGDVVAGTLGGALTGAYVGFIGGMSRPQDKWANMGAAVWHVGKAFSASMVSLGVILPMQTCCTMAMIGMMQHLNGGKALTVEQILAVKVFCDGVSFVAASRPGGTLAGAVMAIGAGIEKLSKDTRFQIRSPASPMMPVMAPDFGGLCFGIFLGARVAAGTLQEYTDGPRPLTPSTPFNPDWMDLASALAAGMSVVLSITTATVMHRKADFKYIPPPRPVDLLIARSSAVGDFPGGSAYAVFALRAGLGPKGLLEMAGAGPQAVAALRGMVFGGGICVLSQQYLVEGTLNDRGAPGEGLDRPLGGLRENKLTTAADTMQGRLAPALYKRQLKPSDPALTRHVREVLRVGFQTMLTVLCVGLALKAAQQDDFRFPQEDLDRMMDTDTLHKVGAGAVAYVLQTVCTPLLQMMARRSDADARRCLAPWVGSALAALNHMVQALGAPSFLGTVSVASAAGAITDEIIHRVRHRGDDSAYSLAMSDGLTSVAQGVGLQAEVPGVFERFLGYVSLAWTGIDAPPQPAPVDEVELPPAPDDFKTSVPTPVPTQV